MADDLLSKLGTLFNTRRREWHEVPRLFAMGQLIEIRNQLREQNLHDTEEPPLERAGPADAAAIDPARREARTTDGTDNDLTYPRMGSVGCRFGRNVPLEHVFPDTANLLDPNPRVVSRELMTRETFQPATILNLLAAAWIQFMVHDWFVHKRSATEAIEIPTAARATTGARRPSGCPRSVPEPAPAGSTRPPAYANLNSHWWDASQIYGCDARTAAALRTGPAASCGSSRPDLLPVDPDTGLHFSGFTDNWWIGLAMLHTLFTLEHNYICDLLAHEHQDWTDEQLFAKAKLINSALMAKIHTVEWTPAILPHPVIRLAMNVNWYGLAGSELQDVFEFLDEKELLGGIVGSNADHHAAPYSLTEEFVSVYRMHPLIPDDLTFHSLVTGRAARDAAARPRSPAARRRRSASGLTMPDLFYSFGTCHPGAITLHNYPRHLQNLTRDDGEHLDLAAVDILRDRERGVPRYNEFRRLLRKEPVTSFDELTDNPAVARADQAGLRRRHRARST